MTGHLNGSPGDAGTKTRRIRTWPLRAYLAALVATFTVAAGGGAIYVQAQANRDARDAAQLDANYAAEAGVVDLSSSILALQTTVARLASTPNIALIAKNPTARCSALLFPGLGLFSVGHFDFLNRDGSVACSGRTDVTAPGGTEYAGADWLASAISGPLLVAPILDSGTGSVSLLSAAPVPGVGVVVGFVDLRPLGPAIAARYGGPRNLEFLVTSLDSKTALARSTNPARWVGAGLAGTPFASSAGQQDRSDVDGTLRLYGQSTVQCTRWRVFAGANLADTTRAATRLFEQELAILLAGLAVVALGTMWTYRRVTVPIHQLRESVRLATARGCRSASSWATEAISTLNSPSTSMC